MACMFDVGVLFLESLLTLVTYVLFCCLDLTTHPVDPVQIFYKINHGCKLNRLLNRI